SISTYVKIPRRFRFPITGFPFVIRHRSGPKAGDDKWQQYIIYISIPEKVEDVTTAAALINLLGFITGTALYAMLLAMVLNDARPPAASAKAGGEVDAGALTDRLPLFTALLGLVWNLGSLLSYGLYELRDSGASTRPAFLVAVAFTALGF